MPLFYFIPFDWKPEAQRKTEQPVVEFKFWNVVLYVVVTLIFLALFGVFIVLPSILAMQASVPAG